MLYEHQVSTFNAGNLMPMLSVAANNFPLIKYLVGELVSTKEQQLAALREFVPDAKPEDWTMVWAGQRVQIVKPGEETAGKIQFGTEVVASADKTLVGLLGASPGASVSPHIAIEVMDNFVETFESKCTWHAMLGQMIPTYGRDINSCPKMYNGVLQRAQEVLLSGASSGHRSSKGTISKHFDKIGAYSGRIGKDGSIRTRHLRSYLKRSGGMDPKAVDELIKRLDKNKDGWISREEFTEGFAAFVTGEVPAEQACGCS